MTTIRKKYNREFKLEAIRMYENGERTICSGPIKLDTFKGFKRE